MSPEKDQEPAGQTGFESAATPPGPGSGHPAELEHASSEGMLPPRERRRSPIERLLVRLIATCGVIGIGVAIAAIMVSSKSEGWLVGLVVSIVSVVLAAILWSSKTL